MTKVKMPEPVAWSVLDKRTGKHWYTNGSRYTTQHYANIYSHNEPDSTPSMRIDPLITTDQAEAYAEARVREALDEAAEIADRNNDFSTYDAIRALLPDQHRGERYR